MAGRFRAAIDGGSRGNPGPAAWGVAILDEHGERVEGHAGHIGHATNNVAEYRALLEALALAVEREADDVEIFADSELVVRQIQGTYRVKNASLKTLYAEALRLIAGLRDFRIVHVRREKNKHADRLVNVALNRAEAEPQNSAVRVVETGPGA